MTGITPEMIEKFSAKIAEYAKNPDKRLQEALDNHNTNMVRSILKLDLSDNDIGFDELVVKALYIAEYFPEQAKAIFEPYALSKLHKALETTDKTLWNEDYFLTHKSYLTLNFAIERLIHLAHVKQELMAKEGKVVSISPKETTFTKEFKEASKLDSAVNLLKKNIGVAIAVIGTVVAVVIYALVELFNYIKD